MYTSTVNGTSRTINYTYDSKGNITNITDSNGFAVSYTYDDLGQLISETKGLVTRTYEYDNAGNITSITQTKTTLSPLPDPGFGPIIKTSSTQSSVVTSTKTLEYTNSQWGDLLTSYDGVTITYDAIGNPLSYYNGTAYTFTWEGRRLVGAVSSSNTMSFEYNDEGIRTSKNVNGVETVYYVNGGQIIAEKTDTRTIVYIYDASGTPIGMMYRTTSYAENAWDVFWYEKNLQGDIIAVYNSSGTKLVTYDYYDAWGNHTVSYSNSGASTGAQYNPFRYRGYYYDSDLGMYYLQSRYYDAKICRFISADGYVSTGQGILGNNMFAYCGNNPVNNVDPTGEGWIGVIILVTFLVLTLTGCSSTTIAESDINLYSNENGSWQEGKINVKFSPDGKDANGNSNPSFQIEDSWEITNRNDQRAILEHIMASDYYSQDLYGRTIDSMLIEWDAHNDIHFFTHHERVAHTDFDKNDEGTSYLDYWIRGIEEWLKSKK